MSAAIKQNWTTEFGIDDRVPPALFTSKDQVTPGTPQSHLLRRAFDVLKLDGVLCAEHSPLAYFRVVGQISTQAVYELHRQFWNHSGASVLVLVADDYVHIYSVMKKPEPAAPTSFALPSLVASLDRVAGNLKEFIIAIESGEFYRQHQPWFDTTQRVDRYLLDNLRNTRLKLEQATDIKIQPEVLDALLCRLVFTCYLFDRGVIGQKYLNNLGIHGAAHLREILGIPHQEQAKECLYKLFNQLAQDFNGDLFSDNLEQEKKYICDKHIDTLNSFFRGTEVATGQKTLFWPYDFEFIPIETISAIYERFLNISDKKKGAFYTPRFLAEVVLDTALNSSESIIGKKVLDPACGSGIFLVSIFNRIAEEWKQANPNARNDRRATELMRLMREGLFGVDISLTACRITAFSLYLAYLDHLSPPDIQALQRKGKALPRLVVTDDQLPGAKVEGNIRRGDFFADDPWLPKDVSLVLGNPPWGSIATDNTPAGRWCKAHARPLPDKQIAAAFAWKAAEHIADDGRICLLLPHGLLFNHSTTAIPFQKAWLSEHAFERVLNLGDLRFLLFEKAIHPALIVNYCKYPPFDETHEIEYWTPKGDWTVTHAEVITVSPQDRTKLSVAELLRDLATPDAPQLWKQRYWATPRDWRLLARLADYPRLRDRIRQTREKSTDKPWIIAQGFQPLGPGDKAEDAKNIDLPGTAYIEAETETFDLFLLPTDCQALSSHTIQVRGRSGVGTEIFRGPHVLVTRGFSPKGFSGCAFADFDVAFRSSIRGIHGPISDKSLLLFLAAYLRSSLATYYLIHTSSSLGIYRPEVHDKDLLQLPFPLPNQLTASERATQIIEEVASIVEYAASQSASNYLLRLSATQAADAAIGPLINEYFDIHPLEACLIEDTIKVTMPSIQPTPSRMPVETVKHATALMCAAYRDCLCKMLNGWGKRSGFKVRGHVERAPMLGIAIAVLEKRQNAMPSDEALTIGTDIVQVLDKIRKAIPRSHATLDVVRGVTVFDGDRLYVVKPIGQRFWTQTAAMNDADEIASTILMRPHEVGT
jgi:N-6 DNA Methylase